MDLTTMVEWVNSVKEKYGDNVQDVMEAHAIANPANAHIAAGQTISFGLLTDDHAFICAFQEAGGDLDYLATLVNAFIHVRSKHFGL